MAYNVLSLINQVQARLDDTGFNGSTLTQFCNDTQREILNGRTFRFTEASPQAFTAVIGQDSIGSLPSDFQMPIDLRITAPVNYATTLQFMDYKDFDRQYPQPSLVANSVPFLWYEYGGTVNVFPRPEQAYTFTLRYYKTPPELTSDSDVPLIPSEFQELLVLGMLKRALQLNDDYGSAYFQDSAFQQLLTQMTQRFGPRKLDGPYVMGINRGVNKGGF